jgi:hypothetical protein
MHTEVHVHGDISLKRGAGSVEIEQALRPWLEYVDVDSLAEATSAREEEPGVALDLRKRLLQICWTGWVGRNFHQALEAALSALCEFTDAATAIEVTYYQEDGRDEFGVVFVGPDALTIERARRQRMIDDVAVLLSRQFGDQEVSQVSALIERLFDEQAVREQDSASATASIRGPVPGRKHLH